MKIKNKMTLAYNRYLVNKFFRSLETRGGFINGKAVLFVYNRERPELSYIITEHL